MLPFGRITVLALSPTRFPLLRVNPPILPTSALNVTPVIVPPEILSALTDPALIWLALIVPA